MVNDIAEEIDHKETRFQQRQAIAILADLLYEAHELRRGLLTEVGVLAINHSMQ